MGLVYLALTLASSFSYPRAGVVSGRSFEPIVAILLFSCTLALHARQVDVKLRLDYLWAAQARGDPLLPFGGGGDQGIPWEEFQVAAPGWMPVAMWASLLGGGGCGGAKEQDGRKAGGGQSDEPCLMVRGWLLCWP